MGRQGDELQVYKIARSRGQAIYVSRACGAIIGRADADCSGALQLALRDVASMESLGKPPRTVHQEADHDSPCHARAVLESQARRP